MKNYVAATFVLLASAVVWSGSTVTAEQAAAAGAAPTFNKDIAPIFYANCTSCHRRGEIAPMSLMTYKDARPWAKAIATKVADGTMPPWHADPSYGKFMNERRLTDAQKTAIARWVSAGAPEGAASDLPAPPAYNDGWNIADPDVVLSMQEDYPIPATGDVPYQYFEVPANFDEDRFIQAWEIKPGDRAAVHHIIVSTRPPADVAAAQAKQQQQMVLNRLFGAKPAAAPANAAPRPLPLFSFACCIEIPAGQTGGRPLPPEQRKAAGPLDRPRPAGTGPSVGGYVPGNSLRRFPAGTAMRLPKGYSLVFQMHYTTYGKPTTDRSKVALKFATTTPSIVLNSATLINGSLAIPPGVPLHQVDAEVTINREIMLYSLVPHTHVRGKKWHYEAIYPDGRKEVILSVPKYDFNWQHEYVFDKPLTIPAGTRIHATAWYDNSTANKSNPDPAKTVLWGDQTWEEMMYTSMTFFMPAAPPTSAGQQ
jgi:hypothetical protein